MQGMTGRERLLSTGPPIRASGHSATASWRSSKSGCLLTVALCPEALYGSRSRPVLPSVATQLSAVIPQSLLMQAFCC